MASGRTLALAALPQAFLCRVLFLTRILMGGGDALNYGVCGKEDWRESKVHMLLKVCVCVCEGWCEYK